MNPKELRPDEIEIEPAILNTERNLPQDQAAGFEEKAEEQKLFVRDFNPCGESDGVYVCPSCTGKEESIDLEPIKNPVCVDKQCYDADILHQMLRIKPEIPHNRRDYTSDRLTEDMKNDIPDAAKEDCHSQGKWVRNEELHQQVWVPQVPQVPLSIAEASSLSGVHSLDCKYLRGNTFIPQPHQKKAIEIYNQLEKGQRGILLYHKFGSGKTCTSILVADDLIKNSNSLNHVWVLTPGNLRRNFHHEYCFVCGKYVADFKKNYTFISYNYGSLKTSEIPSFDNSVVIIDEIHNLIKAYINAKLNKQSVAKALITKLKNANHVKIIALSGDPIYSRPSEAGILFELLKPSLGTLVIDDLLKLPDRFKRLIRNLISYIPGKTEDFPQIVEQIVECKMSPLQTDNFLPIEEIESRIRKFSLKYPLAVHRDFNNAVMTAKLYIRTRRASNFCYPLWAGLNLEWEKEDDDEEKDADEIKAELDEIEAEIGIIEAEVEIKAGEDSEEPDYEARPIPNSMYIVVAREGLPIFETYLNNNNEIKRLNRGDSFIAKNILRRRSFSNGTVKWCITSDNVEGWITLPANGEKKDSVVRSAKYLKNQKRPDQLIPQGWVDERDFKGSLETYSRKFFAVLQNIFTHFPGKHAIFSFFKTRGGLYLMGTFLDMCGISYRLYTGDESDEQKTQILTEYNSPENKDGALIKVILFSFAGSEGMTLTAVQYLHILETDLREGRARQVIGRTARYKSHAILPEEKRKVQVWRYWSVTSFNEDEDQGIDRKLYNNAQVRYDAIQQLLNYFQEASIENMLESAPDEKLDLEEVEPDVPNEFKFKVDENIRYALNRLLYWNYKLLTNQSTKLWKEESKDFRNTLIFDPKHIFQINKHHTVNPLKSSKFKGTQIRDEYLKCVRMTKQLAERDINFLQNIQKQGHASKLMRLFPIILNEIKKINKFFPPSLSPSLIGSLSI